MRHLKRGVLSILVGAGRPLSAGEIARDASLWPIRAVYSYMARLERYRLVARKLQPWGVCFFITEKGQERLRWFEAHAQYDLLRRKRLFWLR